MEKFDVKTLNDNVFETIGKEWILVAAGNKDKFNMMTASWGCLDRCETSLWLSFLFAQNVILMG